MENPTFYIVDVFDEEKYAGNQRAVFRGAGHLPDATLQAVEVNYSETNLVLSGEKRDGGCDIRIFTPEYEVPFAGHPTSLHRPPTRAGVRDRTPFVAVHTGEERGRRDKRLRRQ